MKNLDFRKNNNIIYQCKTEAIAIELFKEADNQGFPWCSGDSFLVGKNQWDKYKSLTCYDITGGCFGIAEQWEEPHIKVMFPLSGIHREWLIKVKSMNWTLPISIRRMIDTILDRDYYNIEQQDYMNILRKNYLETF